MRHRQYWTTLALLGCVAVLLWSRGPVDRVPPSEPLTSFPMMLGPWTGTDVPLEGYVLDVLGKGSFLNRNYTRIAGVSGARDAADDLAVTDEIGDLDQTSRGSSPDGPPIGLFIGYFPTQRTGQAIHSPQNCLPGAGWVFSAHSHVNLLDREGHAHTVGDYIIANGKQQDEVLYWYQEHGRSIASDYTAKWYTLVDSIRYHRTDAALVRVITPVMPGESADQTHRRIVHFANRLVSLLPAYIPN